MDESVKARWDIGKAKTLRFYKAKLPWKSKQFNRIFPLPNYFAPMIGDKKEVKIAELGAGMFCTIGSLWPNTKIKVYPSDALADEFNQILKDHGVTPIIPVKKENMEKLSYPNNFFDIVHCVNALDHTLNPAKAISEMYRAAKPGGFIYLRHFVNVGEHEKYSGLHMWNINIYNNNDCIFWNREEKFLLSEHFSGFKNTMKKEADYETEELVVSILQKEKDDAKLIYDHLLHK